MEIPVTERGGSHNKSAIGNRSGDIVEGLGMLEDVARAYGRAGLPKGDIVRPDKTQLSETEIAHGARDSANV
jgi:hypothetical protein